jgi:hypothetical protein
MFFTGISDDNIYINITPPPGTPDEPEPDTTLLSDPPTPQALHDVLAPLEFEQATELDQVGAFLGDLEVD